MKKFRTVIAYIASILLSISVFSTPAYALETFDEEPLVITEESIADGWIQYFYQDEVVVTPELLTAEQKQAVLDSLFEAEISDVTEAIRLGLVTCEEVTRYYVDRIEKHNSDFNCFITLLTDSAIERAIELDERRKAGDTEGVLFGVPIVVKDNIDVEGVYTTNGLSYSASYVAKKNAAIVDKMLEQGAVILGKTNMSIEAQNARYSLSRVAGLTYNAYSKELTSGGSSGGSAVAVSTNLCLAGLGTDTNSSLRIPAAMNGCVALRFTSGVLDREGIVILNRTRDVPGAITRTVKDTALMADILTDFAKGYSENLDRDALNGVRIGVLKELVNRAYSDDENKQVFKDALAELEQCGAILVDVSLPGLFTYSSNTENGVSGSTAEYLAAYNKMLEKYDVAAVVYPSYLSTPFSSEKKDGRMVADSQNWVNNARPLASAIGIPEISIPIGNHSDGAGLGMEISSSKNNEKFLINLAYSYTEQFPHRTIPNGTYTETELNNNTSYTEVANAVYLSETTKRHEEEVKRQETARKNAVIGAKQMAFEQVDMAREALAIPSLIEATKAVNGPGRTLKVFGIIFLVVLVLFTALRIYAGYIERQRRKKRRQRR